MKLVKNLGRKSHVAAFQLWLIFIVTALHVGQGESSF
jgi:hypothetical protein